MAVIPSKPSSGEATKKSLADAIIDALSDHESQLGVLASGAKNGSFETVTGGAPVEWTISSSNATAASETTEVAHGAKSVKTTFSAGDGSTTWTSEDLIPAAYGERIEVRGQVKANAAGNPAKATILWYQKDGSASAVKASTDVWTNSDVPTSWRSWFGQDVAPSDATYYKVKLTGGGTGSDNTEIIYFDGVESRVYHGLVQIDRSADLGTGTITLASGSGHFVAGERPRKAMITVAYALDATDTITVTGNSKTVFAVTNASGAIMLSVELDDSFAFSVAITGGGTSSDDVRLIAYEV